MVKLDVRHVYCFIFVSESTKVVYMYDDDDDFEDSDIYKEARKSYKKRKYPKDNTFLIKASVYSSKVNTILGLLVLAGVLLLPIAIAAELDLNSISQQISILQGILTDYYVDLLLNTEEIIARLVVILTSLTSIVTTLATLSTSISSISTTLATHTTTLNNIVTLINALG